MASSAVSLSVPGSGVIPRSGHFAIHGVGSVMDASRDDEFYGGFDAGLWAARGAPVDTTIGEPAADKVRFEVRPVDVADDASGWLDGQETFDIPASIQLATRFEDEAVSEVRPFRLETSSGVNFVRLEFIADADGSVWRLTYRDATMDDEEVMEASASSRTAIAARLTITDDRIVVWDLATSKVVFFKLFAISWTPTFDIGASVENGGQDADVVLESFRSVPIVFGFADYREGGLPFVSSWSKEVKVHGISGFPGEFTLQVNGTGSSTATQVSGGTIESQDFAFVG